jgi:hypothetical protein
MYGAARRRLVHVPLRATSVGKLIYDAARRRLVHVPLRVTSVRKLIYDAARGRLVHEGNQGAYSS